MKPADADLLARVTELETRVAFQEQALTDLSDALAATRIEAERSAALLRRVLTELAQSRGGGGDPADEPPPPHY